MYRGRTNAVVYFLLCVSVLITGALVFKQIGFSHALKDRIAQTEDPYFSVKGLQDIVAMNETSLKTFFFIFICFMVILVSLIVVLQSTERAYKLTNESNVKYTVKMTYPAILLAAIGCFFLALAIYRTSSLQMNTSSDLADQKKYQIVLDSLFNKKTELEQGISSLLQQQPAPAASGKKEGKKEQAIVYNSPHKSGAASRRRGRHKNIKTAPDLSSVVGPIAPVITDDHAKTNQKAKDRHPENKGVAVVKPTVPATVKEEAANTSNDNKQAEVSAGELQFAYQLQKQATIYGHYPTSSELNTYNSIYKKLEKQQEEGEMTANSKEPANSLFKPDLHWAFDLLQKAKNGYQPSKAELIKYEQTIERNLEAEQGIRR